MGKSEFKSPYENISKEKWYDITKKLIDKHPLSKNEIIEVILNSWNIILNTRIGDKYKIGEDIYLKPQAIALLLHEIIPKELRNKYPNSWRVDNEKNEKDLVYTPDVSYSIELKTSSSRNDIYGNRSYAQDSPNSTKSKSGYYLAINFEKFNKTSFVNNLPKIRLIRFGWLDHTNWIGQKASTGQQARISADIKKRRFIELYNVNND